MISKISALLEGLTIQDVDATAPAMRRRFAQYCRYWAEIADPSKPPPPKSGVLGDLGNGNRSP
jgi:hypothetical protein